MIPRLQRVVASIAIIGGLLSPATAQSTRGSIHELASALIEAELPAQDDPDRVVIGLMRAAMAVAASPAAASAIDLASGYGPYLKAPDRVLALIASYLQADPHPLGAHAATALRQQVLRRAGRLPADAAEKFYAGYVSAMIAVGPFGDEGDFWSGVTFIPEIAFPAAGESLAGRYGPIQSYPVSRPVRSSSLSLRRPGSDKVGCFYGLHQLDSDRAQAAYLELDMTGSCEVFVNGEFRQRIDRLAEEQQRVRYIPIQLRSGANQILVKTTQNRLQRFSLRYLDARGAALQNCRELSSDRLHPLSLEAIDLPPLLPPFVDALSAITSAARAAPEDDLLQIAAMLAAFRAGDRNRGLGILMDFEDKSPDDPRLQVALARAYDRATRLPEEIRRSRSKSLIESALTKLPEHSYAILRQSRLLAGEDQQESAIRLLSGEIDAGRTGPEIYSQLYSLLSSLDFSAEREHRRRAWIDAEPQDARPILELARERSLGGQRRAALQLILDYLQDYPGDLRAGRRALEIALEIGELSTAAEVTSTLIAASSDPVNILQMQVRLATASSNIDQANVLWAEIAEHPEANAAQVLAAAHALFRSARRSDALAAYRRSLALEPSQPQIRRLLRRVDDEPEDYPLIARYRYSGAEIIGNFEVGEREQSAPSSLLLDQMIIRYYEDGSSVAETHQLRRINDLRGVEAREQADRAANAGEIIQLRTIGKDGLSYLPTRVAGSFSMPRLEPGAFIEEEYREFSPSPGPTPLRGTTFFFQGEDEPFLLSELVVILPPQSRGSFRSRNFAGEVIEEELADGYRAHIYRMRDVPRTEPEPNTPPPQDILPVIAFGEDRSPTAIPRAVHARMRAQLASNPLLEAKARELCSGMEGQAEQAAAIYRFVQDQIQDGRGGGSPTATLMRGQGDRFHLFLALLESLHIPMQLAAAAQAHESLMGLAEPFFLGEEAYPIPAALVLPDTKDAFWAYAGSPRYAPMGFIAANLLGAPMLLLSLGSQELSRLPAGDRRAGMGWQVTGKLNLEADGKAILVAKAEIRGATGYELAEQIRKMQANRRSLVARSLAGQMFQGWTVDSAKLGRLEPGDSLSLEATVVKRQALSPAGSEFLLALPLSPTNLFAQFGGPSKRSQPLQLTGFTHSSWEVEIDPGDAFQIANIPQTHRLQHRLLDHELLFRIDDGKLILRMTLTRRPGRLPASSYPEWRQMLRRLDLVETSQIKLRSN